MSNEDGLRLEGSLNELEGKKKKKSASDVAYTARMIARYKLKPRTSPEEVNILVDEKERAEAVALCHKKNPDCPLKPSATWAEINTYNKKQARRDWAEANGINPELPDEAVDYLIEEQGRLRAARKAELPLDTSWPKITMELQRREDERRAKDRATNREKNDEQTEIKF